LPVRCSADAVILLGNWINCANDRFLAADLATIARADDCCTCSLGTKLLALEREAIDAIATLQSNLAEALTIPRPNFGAPTVLDLLHNLPRQRVRDAVDEIQ